MNTVLTKDGEYLICAIYETYKDKRKAGLPKAKAKYMNSSKEIHSAMMSEWLFDDVDDTCRELGKAGLLDVFYADNIAYRVTLNDAGISYMENRLANDILDILDYMAKIKKAILF